MVKHLSERGEEFVSGGKLAIRKKRLLYSPNYPKTDGHDMMRSSLTGTPTCPLRLGNSFSIITVSPLVATTEVSDGGRPMRLNRS